MKESASPGIIHRLGIQASPARVYKALATRSGLMNWWTWHVTGEPAPGATVRLRFGSTSTDMKALELQSERVVKWSCTAGSEGWKDTVIAFELAPGDRETIVHFSHTGWDEAGERLAHWNCKWGYFLMSLKTWVEDGKGTPYPEDRKISSWG